MRRSPQEFLNFIAKHHAPIAEMCRDRLRFSSDDDIASFLRRFDSEDKNLSKLVGRMKEVGVLVDVTGEWSPPPFLIRFLRELGERHSLASPAVIRAWVEKLQQCVGRLDPHIEPAMLELDAVNADEVEFLLREISDTFQIIVDTVQENCERISGEVSGYRIVDDSSEMRSRLGRLIVLYDEFLEPVLRVLDIGGEFREVSEQIAHCCFRLSRLTASDDLKLVAIGEEARVVRQDVVWLRRVVVRRAEETRRELGPLCEAARRESQIAKGVNHALKWITDGRCDDLNLEDELMITEDKDGTTFSDLAVERYLSVLKLIRDERPPRIVQAQPTEMEAIITVDDLIDQLEFTDSLDDLLDWVLERCEDSNLGEAVRLFHAIIERCPDEASYTFDRRDYEREAFLVNATRWTWGRHDDDNGNSDSDLGVDSIANEDGLPVASQR